ncbi:MAG: DUF3071 domain-containing protein [Salinibacterium sp.]|nr:MAG: DUF3071 domain-containing protein [Salinibacterium sp.]
MQDLRVVGVEGGALVAASDDGERFRIPIDEVLHSKLRQSVPDAGMSRKLAPREIQAHIRSGMSAQDVASITGVPLDYIQRFEGPVLAEREFVVQTALDVPVHATGDNDPMRLGKTFGTAIRERLHDIGAINERWASWKDLSTGWVVKLSFVANQIEHDARWHFDPKKQSLSPANTEATTLSQQGDVATGPLMPRLRAVAPDAASARFDSGAFSFDESLAESPVLASVGVTHSGGEESPGHGHQTADLLEALRRRRGERDAMPFDEGPQPAIRAVELPLTEFADEPDNRTTAPQGVTRGSRRGRAAMPSWDEIVFGARVDPDPAG